MVELLIVKVENLNLVIITIYRPPNTNLEKFREQLSKLDNYLRNTCSPLPNIIFLGDFNFPHLKWVNQDGQAKINELTSATRDVKNQVNLLFRLCNDYSLTQYISGKTRKNNTLDLLFTNNEDLVHDIKISPTINSNHNLIEITSRLIASNKSKTEHLTKERFAAYNFNKKDINWTQIKQSISSIDWDPYLSSRNTNETFEEIDSLALLVCESHITKRKNKKRPKIHREKRLMYKRRKLITIRLNDTITSLPHRKNLEKELVKIESNLKLYYKNESEKEEENAIKVLKTNPRFFYSYAKKKSSTSSSIGPLLKADGSYTINDEEICEILRRQYKSVFSKPKTEFKIESPEEFFLGGDMQEPNITDIEFTPDDFIKAIDKMPMHSAPGPDTWNSVFIKKNL